MPKVRLTDRSVKSAKASPGERLELFDQQTLGLILRVSDRGMKSWAVRYRTVDGMQRRHALGRYPELGLSEAREAALAVLRDSRAGRDPSAERVNLRRAARAQPIKTMADLKAAYFLACESGEWRPRKKQKREITIRWEKEMWDFHIAKPLGDVRVDEVTPETVKRILKSIVAAGHPTTSNRVRALLRQVFNYAIAESRIENSPITRVAAMAPEKARDRVLTDIELNTLWTALTSRNGLSKKAKDGEPVKVRLSEALAIAIKVQAMTLTRRSDVTGMSRTELDLENGVWIIPAHRSKNGVAHMVPLPDPAIALIKRAIEIADEGKDLSTAAVFPSPRDRKQPIKPAAVSHALRDVRLALELNHFNTHDLRRTAASIMASERLGITPFLIGRVLNHTTETGGAAVVTMRHYALHDFASEKRMALEAWIALLLEIVGEKTRVSNIVQLRSTA